MAIIFIRGGLGKIGAHEQTVAAIAKDGFPLPALAYWVALAVEFLGGLAVLVGFQARLAGLALAAFCLATAVQVHFDPAVPMQMVNFYKNVCMAGGFLQLFALGAGGWSVDARMSRRG